MIQPQEELVPELDEIPLPHICEMKLQELREARNKTRLPQSLTALAIKAVAKHCTRFIDIPDSPLKYLPNTIVQQFLSAIASGMGQLNTHDEKMLIPLVHLKKVLGLLLNESVTEIDCTVFESVSGSYKFNKFVQNHALINCPKISKVELTTTEPYLFIPKRDVLPVERFKKSWNNLKSINCQNNYTCTEDTLKLILENYPNIEELSISVNKLSQAGVDHLINMKRLHTLHFDDNEVYSDNLIPDFIISAAGEVPNLQNYAFRAAHHQNQFIDNFAGKYPKKELLVKQLTVVGGLQKKWPKNLSVKRLEIHGFLTASDIENLSTIECNLELYLDCVAAGQMYQLLERMGHFVKRLIIGDMYQRKPNINYISSEIILERILAACPNLEHFEFETICRAVVEDNSYNLPPAAFKNYHSFSIPANYFEDDDENPSLSVVQQAYQKFLIGSEKCEKLELNHYEQLRLVSQVALTYPKSLRQLREVECGESGYNLSSILSSITDLSQRNEVCNMYHKCIFDLLTCCHKLEKIFIALPFACLESLHESSFMATIKAIDPDVMEFYQWMRVVTLDKFPGISTESEDSADSD